MQLQQGLFRLACLTIDTENPVLDPYQRIVEFCNWLPMMMPTPLR